MSNTNGTGCPPTDPRKVRSLFEIFGVVFKTDSLKGNVWAQSCPFCDHAKFYVNVESAQWDCKRCQRSGNEYTFLRLMYDEALSATSDDVLDSLASDRQPLTPDTLKRHGLAYSERLNKFLIPYRNDQREISSAYQWATTWEGWLPHLGKSLLFRYETLKDGSGKPLMVCEGPWDAMALSQFLHRVKAHSEYDVVALPDAKTFSPRWCKLLKGRTVYLLLDNDEEGRKGTQKAIETINESKVRCKLRSLEWPHDYPPRCDMRDLLGSDHDPLKFALTHCKAVRSGKVISPPPAPPEATSDNEDEPDGSWEDVSQIVGSIEYLVPDWLPLGMVTGLVAEPKIGKSALALAGIVGPLVMGGKWFSGVTVGQTGNVVWCDTEGRAGINVDRCTKWGITKSGIKVPYPHHPLRQIDLANDEDIKAIVDTIKRHDARLLVVDSLRGAHSGDENSSMLATYIRCLTDIAETLRVAVLLIHHTRKMSEGEELTKNSARGSNAFLGLIACQILVDAPDPKSSARRVRIAGENLGINPAPVGFTITDTGLTYGDVPCKQRKPTLKDDAIRFLKEKLVGGVPSLASDIIEEAEQHALKRDVLARACEALGVVINKGADKKWRWTRPLEDPK